MKYKSNYHRYQLTYPFEGDTIYLSKSPKKAIKRCYHEYKRNINLNNDTNKNNTNKNNTNKNDNIFIVTDLDDKIEYKFKINQRNKLNQIAGEQPTSPTLPVLKIIINEPIKKEHSTKKEEKSVEKQPKLKLPLIPKPDYPGSESSGSERPEENIIDELEENIQEFTIGKSFIDDQLAEINKKIDEIEKKIKASPTSQHTIPPKIDVQHIADIKLDIQSPTSPVVTAQKSPVVTEKQVISYQSSKDAYYDALRKLETYKYLTKLEKNENNNDDEICSLL